MKLEHLRLEGFRGFADASIVLEPDLTLIVGVNGAGKSSVLDAAAMLLQQTLSGVLNDASLPSVSLLPMDFHRAVHEVHLEGRLRVDPCRPVVALDAERDAQHALTLAKRIVHAVWPEALRTPGHCLAMYYPTSRDAAPDLRTRWKSREGSDGARDETPAETTPADALVGALTEGAVGFHDLFRWFRDREDYENAEKVARASLAWVDPQLEAVRVAVTRLLPTFSRLRVDRKALRMAVDKGAETFYLDQLSDGERTLLAMVADIARRLAIANPCAADPLGCEAVVLIDEVELHLHPAWQRAVPRALRRVFPGVQFVLTTHSPQVIGEVPARCVRLLRDGHIEPVSSATWGRDSNRILEVLMGTSSRSEEVAADFTALAVAEDEERWDDAWALVDTLRAKLGEDDPDVSYYAATLPPRDGESPAAR